MAVILAIVHTGSFISFVYAALLMLWGVLSIPWPSKRFWLSLMFFTMLVLVAKYIYQFLLVTVIVSGVNYLFIGDFAYDSLLTWLFGVYSVNSYFSNAVFNLLLLMSLVFHRGLLKVSRLGLLAYHYTTTGVRAVEERDRTGVSRQCHVCCTLTLAP